MEHSDCQEEARIYPDGSRRAGDRGRMAPHGLRHVSSWVDENFEVRYQLLETADRRLLDEWMTQWEDLVEFEVRP